MTRLKLCIIRWLPEFNERLPEFNKRLPEFNKRLPEFNKRLPEFNKRLPEFNKRLPEFNKRLPEFNKRLPEFNKRLPEFNKRLPEFNKRQDLGVGFCSSTQPCILEKVVDRPNLGHNRPLCSLATPVHLCIGVNLQQFSSI